MRTLRKTDIKSMKREMSCGSSYSARDAMSLAEEYYGSGFSSNNNVN
jgi:hypothetical protein